MTGGETANGEGADGTTGNRSGATGSGSGSLRPILLGETGFERATVWSAVGLALSYVAFDATAAAGVGAPATAGVLAAVTALGALAFAATGGGVLPTVLLAYGPLAGTLLRAAGPTPYASPLGADGPTLLAVAEPLGVAVAAALAIGVAAAVVGYAVGRSSD
ncbi:MULTISPECIES: hypothetical protein [Halorubrum]|uniref:Uncharacterized protein n=1 Tax=Halorubrum hochstenium ATCC 700873 TaxID=1227481 RepID=M0F230_9EURY|nr:MULTISPECIES: hypothetical protein [Halorubrum]ELZ53398.1 hypothetical protein C467_13577 [Halorubrum hochstenium ATCC 700873]